MKSKYTQGTEILHSEHCEVWRKDGKLHRDGGPAVIGFRRDGTKRFEEYYQNGESHREDGHALLYYRVDGSTTVRHYAFNGEFITITNLRKLRRYIDLDDYDKVALKLAFG